MKKITSKTKQSRKSRYSRYSRSSKSKHTKQTKHSRNLRKVSTPRAIVKMQLQAGGAEHLTKMNKDIRKRAVTRRQELLAKAQPQQQVLTSVSVPATQSQGGVNIELIKQKIMGLFNIYPLNGF